MLPSVLNAVNGPRTYNYMQTVRVKLVEHQTMTLKLTDRKIICSMCHCCADACAAREPVMVSYCAVGAPSLVRQ